MIATDIRRILQSMIVGWVHHGGCVYEVPLALKPSEKQSKTHRLNIVDTDDDNNANARKRSLCHS